MAVDDQDPDDELEIDDPVEQVTDLEDETTDPVDEPEDQPEPEAVAKEPVKDQQQTEVPSDRRAPRAERRIQTLTEELRERDQRLAETNRRIDELTRQVAQPPTPRETPEQRATRFALMSPQEQISESLRESEQRHAAQLNQVQMQMLDTADRTSFQTKAAVDPLYAKWGPKVEGKLAELRAKGNNIEREVLLKFMIGEAALERRGSKEGRTEVRQAQRRVAAQRTRPTNSGSDQPAQRRQQGDSLERRLENLQI